MRGCVSLDGYNIRTGKHEPILRTHNLVVDGMYEKLVKLVGGDVTDVHYVNRMQFGTGATAPTSDDAFLQRPITPVKAVSGSVVEPYSVTYTTYLLADEANGFPIAEAGLLAGDDSLVARTTFSARTKTSSYIWGITWTVTTKVGSAPATDYTVPVETTALASIMFGAMIVGEAEAATVYGDLVTDQEMTLTGMQATVLGQPPTGADLVTKLRVDGVNDSVRGVTVTNGNSSATSSFSTALTVPSGTRLQVYADTVGTTTPGDWVLFFYNLRVGT